MTKQHNKDWKKRFDDEFAVNNCNCGSFFAWADCDGYTPDEIKQFIEKELETARQEERDRIFSKARDQYDKETKERVNNRKAVVDKDKQGNIYIIALRERVIGRLTNSKS